MGWQASFTMCRLERGWLAEYVRTSQDILQLLNAANRNNDTLGEATSILYIAYSSAWSFRLPGDSDAEWAQKRRNARKHMRTCPARILQETDEEMRARVVRRRQV